MTDPRRIARGDGFAAQLLRAGADEQPGSDGVSRTLAALGLSSAVLTSTTVAGAAAAGGQLASAASGGAAALSSATATGALSIALVTKWIGIGVVGGVGFAGVASVVSRTTPAPANRVSVVARGAVAPRSSSAANVEDLPRAAEVVPTAEPSLASPIPLAAPRLNAAPLASTVPEADLGAPLSAEVEFVDRGRALLRGGRDAEGLALLEGYEQQFSEARLLPEVLFLKLAAYERLGRTSEARRVAERLLRGFPKSPHAARARKLLEK